jgi:hypothetical protein
MKGCGDYSREAVDGWLRVPSANRTGAGETSQCTTSFARIPNDKSPCGERSMDLGSINAAALIVTNTDAYPRR